MKRGCFFLLCALIVLVCPVLAQADYDFSISNVDIGTSGYHVKNAESPSIQVEYDIHLAGSENPASSIAVTVALCQDSSTVASKMIEVGISDLNPGGEVHRSYQFPLYGEQNYELHEGDYYFVVTVDSTSSFPETNENNNSAQSALFDYRILSGDLYFGGARTSVVWSLIDISDGSCGYNHPYHITNGNGSWIHSWGNSPVSFSNLCADGSTNEDGYSVDMHLVDGGVVVGTLQKTVAGLIVRLENVWLDPNGMNYDHLTVDLPEGVTAHVRAGDRIHPIGKTHLDFSLSGPVADPGDIKVVDTTEYYFHSYGLPFYLMVGENIGGSLSFSLDAASQGVQLEGQPFYVHMDTLSLLGEQDRRKNTGLPSNDILYMIGYHSVSFINGSGLQGDYGFFSFYDLYGGSQTKTYTHFPLGCIEWEQFFAQIENGRLVAQMLAEGEEDPIRFTMTVDRGCGECPGSPAPEPATYSPSLLWSVIGEDGAFGGLFEMLGERTSWGSERNGEITYSKNDGECNGVLYFPGFIATGTGNGSHTLGQYLLGSRSFPDSETLGTISYIHDSNNQDATRGNGFFAGITMGPAILEEQVDPGISELIDSSPLNILFNGNTSYSDFTLTSHSKYVLRPGGLTGVFNTDFSGPLTVYGYTLQLRNFAFRQVLNQLDDETMINGYLDLPDPAGIRVAFEELELTCSGDFSAGTVDKEPENQQKGIDDDGDGLVDEGWYQALQYWNIPIDYLGMAFVNPAGDCPDGNQKLKLITLNQVNGISKRLTLTSLWEPDGTPLNDKVTGPAQLMADSQTGFSIQVKDGYLNRPLNANWIASEPAAGFTNLISSLDTPLFNDPAIHGHFQNGNVDSDGAVSEDDYQLWFFNDQSPSDINRDGVPDGYQNITFMNDYRQMLDCSENSASCSFGVNPDPRPEVEYSWPSSGIIHLDYRLNYQVASDTEEPRFLGIKEDTKLPDSPTPILTLYSVPDYITPERTKLSFGAGADFSQLKNLHVALTTAATRSFLHDVLGIDLTLDLDDLFDARAAMLALVGSDLSSLTKTAVKDALESGDIATHTENLAARLRIIHGAPAKIVVQVQSPLLLTQKKARKVVVPVDSSGRLLPSSLKEKLRNLYSDNNLAGLIAYDPALYSGFSDLPDAAAMQDLERQMGCISTGLKEVIGILKDARLTIQAVKANAVSKNSIIEARNGVASVVGQIKNDLDGMTDFFDPDIGINPVLKGMQPARDAISEVKNQLIDIQKIKNTLNDVNNALSNLHADTGSSTVDEVILWLSNNLPQLESLLADADQLFQQQVNSQNLNGLFADSKASLDALNTATLQLATNVNTIIDSFDDVVAVAGRGVKILEDSLAELLEIVSGQPEPYLGSSSPTTWAELVAAGKDLLNQYAMDQLSSFATLAQNQGNPGQAQTSLGNLAKDVFTKGGQTGYFSAFTENLMEMISAPLDNANDKFAADLAAASQQLLSFVPAGKAEDIRGIILTATMNSTQMENMNNAFYRQFDFVSKAFDGVITYLSAQINRLLDQLVAAASKDLADKLSSVTKTIGVGDEGGLSAAKIDGYAIVSQDEVERFHLEAEFKWDDKPDPTIFHGGFDFARWRPVNGRASECCPSGNNLIDVSIFTRHVPAKIMGGQVKIREALLGFTLNEAIPYGIFGHVYCEGAFKTESATLEDLGAEVGLAWGTGSGTVLENYFGAKCRARFSGMKTHAAFFLGQSCKTKIIERLDPDYKTYVGSELTRLTGFYTRASVRVPIYNLSCMLRLGVGADFGIWYFADSPSVYGGLLGGSIDGTLVCLVSGKGALSLGGSKTGDQFVFGGGGWAACGIGFCDPGGWNTISDSRNDSWCATFDASFKVQYTDDWHLNDRQTSGPH